MANQVATRLDLATMYFPLYLIILIQLCMLILFIWVTGRIAMLTHPAWRAKVFVLFSLDCIKSVMEDMYFRSRQRVIDCSDKAGCVAVVTGGGRGLGYHVVRGLVERGMHVVVGVRNPDNCKSMEEVFKKEGLKGMKLLFPLFFLFF